MKLLIILSLSILPMKVFSEPLNFELECNIDDCFWREYEDTPQDIKDANVAKCAEFKSKLNPHIIIKNGDQYFRSTDNFTQIGNMFSGEEFEGPSTHIIFSDKTFTNVVSYGYPTDYANNYFDGHIDAIPMKLTIESYSEEYRMELLALLSCTKK